MGIIVRVVGIIFRVAGISGIIVGMSIGVVIRDPLVIRLPPILPDILQFGDF